MDKNKKIAAGVIAGIIVIGLGIWYVQSGKPEQERGDTTQPATVTDDQSQVPAETPATTTPAETPGSQPGSGGSQGSLTYTEAVKKYEGRRIQFDDACQAAPFNVTFKNGTEIMLDNRSAKNRTIKFDAASYSIKGYGFRIITLSSKTLPKTYLVDCDSSQNVTTVLVQK